jgi:hypothetical protein
VPEGERLRCGGHAEGVARLRGSFYRFQNPPCTPQTYPVLLHLLHVNPPALGRPLHPWHIISFRWHFSQSFIAIASLGCAELCTISPGPVADHYTVGPRSTKKSLDVGPRNSVIRHRASSRYVFVLRPGRLSALEDVVEGRLAAPGFASAASSARSACFVRWRVRYTGYWGDRSKDESTEIR